MSDRQLNIVFELNEATVKKVLKRILQDAIMIGTQQIDLIENSARTDARGAEEDEGSKTEFGKWGTNNNSEMKQNDNGSPKIKMRRVSQPPDFA